MTFHNTIHFRWAITRRHTSKRWAIQVSAGRLFIGHSVGLGGPLGNGGQGVSCLLESWGWRLLITGTVDRAGLATVVEWSAVFDLITESFIFSN